MRLVILLHADGTLYAARNVKGGLLLDFISLAHIKLHPGTALQYT